MALFQEMTYGVLSDVHYCPNCAVLNGRLVFSSRAQGFLAGDCMEITVRKVANILKKLGAEKGIDFKLYSNVTVV